MFLPGTFQNICGSELHCEGMFLALKERDSKEKSAFRIIITNLLWNGCTAKVYIHFYFRPLSVQYNSGCHSFWMLTGFILYSQRS